MCRDVRRRHPGRMNTRERSSRSKSVRNRRIGAVVLAGAVAVASIGLAVGTAVAAPEPGPAPAPAAVTATATAPN